jgi:hypothetical protein
MLDQAIVHRQVMCLTVVINVDHILNSVAFSPQAKYTD